MPNIPETQLLYYAIPVFVVLMLVEIGIHAYERRDWYDTKDTFSSLAMGVGNVITGFFAKGIALAAYFLVYQFRLFDLGAQWWVWVLCFFAEDFAYYWHHRISHASRYFWASHVVHHSSQQYNLSTALRQTWTGLISGTWIFWIWLPLLGFHPLMIGVLQSISLIYQFWIHTESIGKLWWPIEAIFNTPSHHRVHHASDVKYLDRNHAGVLIIWDRLFGTFQLEEEQPTYGLTNNISSHNPLYIATHEWQSLLRDQMQPLTLRQRIGYLFGPPGYSHDGSRKTSAELKKYLSGRGRG